MRIALRFLVPLGFGLGGVLTAPLAAQSNEELRQQLAAERAARIALEKRLAELESKFEKQETDDLDAQLARLVAPGDLDIAPKTTIFPSAANPAIGVFANAVADGGNFDSKFDTDDNQNFSMRETEVDMRLPLSPFAEGVAVFAWEDEGNNDFDSTLEEGYANLGLGKFFDNDWTTMVKVGRSKPIFGRNNQLHAHDWLQVNQPLPVQNLLGDEGLIGNGFNVHQPLWHWGEGEGRGRTMTLDYSLVDGDMLSGEGALGDVADAGGESLDADDPMLTARLSQFVELGPLSDLEVGVSTLQGLGGNSVQASPGPPAPDGVQSLGTRYWDADVTWRTRDDETGIGSWLVQAEWLRTAIDYGNSGNPDFPVGTQDRDGWWLTTQRQLSPTVYLGLLYARSDELGNSNEERSISPYLTWYADEFFRIRWQLDFQNEDVADGPDVNGAYRALMQFTWNFGVHAPHPYWVNK